MTINEAKNFNGFDFLDFQIDIINDLIDKIYYDFEEQLDMEKRKAYLEGSNDCFKALKETGKFK